MGSRSGPWLRGILDDRDPYGQVGLTFSPDEQAKINAFRAKRPQTRSEVQMREAGEKLEDKVMAELKGGPKLLSEIMETDRNLKYGSVAQVMARLKNEGKVEAERAEADSLRLRYRLAGTAPKNQELARVPHYTAVSAKPKEKVMRMRVTPTGDSLQLLKPGDMLLLASGAALMTTAGLFSFRSGEQAHPSPEEVNSAKRIVSLQADITETVRL